MVIPMTIACSYGTLHLTHMYKIRPEVYAFYVLITLAAYLFQLLWYRMAMELHVPARFIQLYFVQRRWRTNGRTKRLVGFKGLVNKGGTFHVFKQWRPPQFIKHIILSTIKAHLFLHSNVTLFKKRQVE